MKTFCVQTLGCKVNQYEGEQLAAALRARGLVPAADPRHADLRLVHTCSVTVQAASKSRQTVRRAVRLPLLASTVTHGDVPSACSASGCGFACSAAVDQAADNAGPAAPEASDASVHVRDPVAAEAPCAAATCDDAVTQQVSPSSSHLTGCRETHPSVVPPVSDRPRVIVTGCWATSDSEAAGALPGVDAVLTHRDDVAAELDQLLAQWREADSWSPHAAPVESASDPSSPEPISDDGWMIKAGAPAGGITAANKSNNADAVKKNPAIAGRSRSAGMTGLPVLGQHQAGRQRAFLKVQDGCDAHCTYCTIPKLRPAPWSKPVEAAVEEAKALVDAGHVELVLTGIFLGAYGQPTALRRRQQPARDAEESLGGLVAALCTRVPGLRRVRLSSLEPGDLTPKLIAVLRDHAQVVPHFHLPLQSGSDALLRRMNRQYTRDDFLRMLDRVQAAFDRPALTTDVILGFPGESDDEFARTADVVDRARFIHVHAFGFSPRPGTAAARWAKDFVRGPVVNARIDHLRRSAASHSLAFREMFLGETVELLVESDPLPAGERHGRCERYFDVTIPAHPSGTLIRPGDFVRARVADVTPDATFAEVLR